VDFNVNYAYAPTQADIDEIEAVIQGAHRILCDATEGQLGFGNVWLTSGAGGKSRADVWIMPPGMWQRSSNLGFILEDHSRVFLMPGNRTMYTFAHEMGHAVFRLRDEYGEQNRFGRYDGIGFAIEPGICSITGDRCWTSANCDGAETCNHSTTAPITLTDQIHTIMARPLMGGSWPNQEVPHECVNPNLDELDPPPTSSLDPCRSDYDCPQDEFCAPHEFYSEFLKADHFDKLPGNGLVCPEDRPGKTITLVGLLGASADDEDENNADPFLATTWEDAKSTSTFDRSLDFIDVAGVVTRAGQGSHHEIGVYFKHINRSERLWEIHFLIATNRLQGANPQDTSPHVLESRFIDFNGGATTYAPLGVSAYEAQLCNPSAGFCDLDPITIPDLANTESPWSLDLDVSQLVLHDGSSWRLRRSIVLANGDLAQRGNCEASGLDEPCDTCEHSFCDICAEVYNTNTDRWESSSMRIAALMDDSEPPYYDSEWHQIADSPNRHPPCDPVGNPECPDPDPDAFHGELTIPSGDPQADPETRCWEPIEIITTVAGSDAIVLAIDVSHSMTENFTSVGETAPRIEWAKGAARALADLVAQHNDHAVEKQALGLVTFATEAHEKLPLQEIDSDDFDDVVAIIDGLTTGGETALADGLWESWEVIETSSLTHSNPAIVAMTDGYANVCFADAQHCNGSMMCDCQWEPADHAVGVVQAVDSAGVTVYFTPLGAEHGQGLFGDAVEQASGEVFPAPEAWDLGMQYARSYLRISGISPTIDALPWVAVSPTVGAPFLFDFPVEEGAGTLMLLLTASNLDVENWDPAWTVVTPSDTHHHGDPGPVDVYDDPSGSFYRILRIDAPEAGTYEVGLSSFDVEQRGSVMVWTDSPEPGCWVAAGRTVVYDDGEDLEIMVSATHEGPLEEVDYEAVVLRPDGSDPVPIVLMPDRDEPGMVRGVFPAAEFHGRGQYLVVATCDASNAWFHPGESLDDEDELLPAVRAPEFLRAGSTSFFLEIPEYGWLPPGGDCDGNGIPDECEGASCADGWGSCQGDALPCNTYNGNQSLCDAQPGCGWRCISGCVCWGGARSCDTFSSGNCDDVDGCDWDEPRPCPPHPSSLDTNGNGILDACDPDNTGSDVPDSWESPWCAEVSEPCTSLQCGVTVECCPGLTCGSAGACEEPCSDVDEYCEDHGDCCGNLICWNDRCAIPV
jgi:hypothetical protein